MQYYVKIFNQNTDTLVGYYKTSGRNCISKMKNGMKYWTSSDEALSIAKDIDGAFIRDKDKHYYIGYAVVVGDPTKQIPKEEKKSIYEKEEELQNALETFIRKNSNQDEF